MQLVSKRWYTVFNVYALVVCLLMAAAYFLNLHVSSLQHYSKTFYFTSETTTLSIIIALYIILILIFSYKRSTYWFTTLIGILLYSLNQLNMVAHIHNKLAAIYLIVWLITVAYSGAFGKVALIYMNAQTTLFVFLQSDFIFSQSDIEYKLMLISTYLVSLLCYLFLWKKIYVNADRIQYREINQISEVLKENEERSAILIESIPDGVVVIDNNNKIALINSAGSTMTEWPQNEAVGLDFNLVIKINQENGNALSDTANPLKQAIIQKQRVIQNVMLNSKSGKQMVVSMSISPIISPKETTKSVLGVVVIIHDISKQKAVEKQKEDFVSTASHEMRTPIAAIEGYLALAMNDRVSHIDEKARSFLEKAHQSTRQLSKLFQDLLTTTKAEDGRLPSHPIIMDMGQFIQQLSEEFQLAAQQKHIPVDYVLSSSTQESGSAPTGSKVVQPLFYIFADPDRLREVLTNLFDNAVKYTESGKITIGLSGTNDTVSVTVKDTGQGIPADDIPHLFQKFYRVDNTATRTIGGTGLGLFICKRIVELYNGRIWVESELGKGSTFHVDFPRIKGQMITIGGVTTLAGAQTNV